MEPNEDCHDSREIDTWFATTWSHQAWNRRRPSQGRIKARPGSAGRQDPMLELSRGWTMQPELSKGGTDKLSNRAEWKLNSKLVKAALGAGTEFQREVKKWSKGHGRGSPHTSSSGVFGRTGNGGKRQGPRSIPSLQQAIVCEPSSRRPGSRLKFSIF